MTGPVIIADDRTGALETAGAIAERDGTTVRVRVGAQQISPFEVVDLATRHVDPSVAAKAVSRLALAGHDGWIGHKLDSLLRGNFVAEIGALQRSSARRVLVVPASPAIGRTCVGGVVLDSGTPVDQLADGRSPARTSRPADVLGAVGLVPEMVGTWVAAGEPLAVCDAGTADDIATIAAAVEGAPGLVISGPAAVIAATCPTWSGSMGHRTTQPDHVVGGGVAVVVGSVHPAALAQADELGGLDNVTVVRTDMGAGETADEILAELACRAAPHLAAARTIVIVGGDTAAAVLGDEIVEVGGLVAVGMPWFASPRFPGATVITKPGSFGGPSLLADVVSGRMSL